MSSSGGSSARKLGRYHLVEPIGGGPTGEVFRAKVYGVAGFERQFAVKRFHAELVRTPGASSYFAKAARAYGSLEHPRIARMQEFGVAGGETFVAIEMVEGIDVSRLIAASYGQGEPLMPGLALTVIKQAARAIGYAHGRGIHHLGVCPTNIICQPDGESKVTDFGFLPPRLPARPADDMTLAARMPYLAPEQIVGEETSAATDVFQLGVVMYELLTGKKPFSGRSSLEISQAILSAAPPDPPLPKAVVTLLRRALARSPLERFPDAGALADGIEAAMRATPLPGNARDAANLVRKAIQQRSQMNSEQMSGAFAFPMPAPPMAAPTMPSPADVVPSAMPASAAGEAAASDAGESPLAAALRRGKQPPPIPAVAAMTSSTTARRTVLGVGATMPVGGKQPPIGHVDEDAPTRIREDVAGRDPRSGHSDVTPLPAPIPTNPALDLELDLDEMPTRSNAIDAALAEPVEESREIELPASGAEPLAVMEVESPASEPPPAAAPGGSAPRARSSRGLIAALAVVALGAGGYFGYQQLFADGEPLPPAGRAARPAPPAETPPAEAPPADATPAVAVVGEPADAAPAGATGEPADAAPAVAAPADAAPAVAVVDEPPDAAPVAAVDEPPDREPAPAGKLVISSTPARAEIYLDGSSIGFTPMTLDATPDRHTVALIKPGHALYVGEVDGSGRVDIALAEVTPPNGRAGIKVRCKKKNRYYVILNGEDTGQLCPTERLGVSLGEQVVEIYDPVTDTRNTFKANVQETRRSLRVRID